MIKTEFLNDGTLIKHYSDAGFIIQTPSEIWEAAHNKEDDDEEDFENEQHVAVGKHKRTPFFSAGQREGRRAVLDRGYVL